jgi:hypothetical protein
MNATVKKLLFGLAALQMLTLAAVAQDAQAPLQGKAAERVEQFKKIRMMEVLGLDEQSSIKFFSRYNKNLDVMKEFRQKQVQTLARIQDLRRNKASDDEYGRVVNDLRSTEEQINQAKSKYIDGLRDVLTNKQLAEYLVFEVRFQQNLRELVRDAQQLNRKELPKR